MTPEDLNLTEKKFYSYTSTFISGASDPGPYLLKQKHTAGVCTNMDILTESIGLPLPEKTIARATALLHDIGRFSQFKIFGTFSDPVSRNHAALGTGVIIRNKFLPPLPKKERRLILRAIALHNRADIPEKLPHDLLRLTRLLRDADKLDIFRVMTALYLSKDKKKSGYITHNLPDNGKIPDELIDMLISGKRPDYSLVKSLNDMKLFQLSMIYDLNFPVSFDIIKEKEVVGIYAGSMPGSPKMDLLKEVMNNYIEKKRQNAY